MDHPREKVRPRGRWRRFQLRHAFWALSLFSAMLATWAGLYRPLADEWNARQVLESLDAEYTLAPRDDWRARWFGAYASDWVIAIDARPASDMDAVIWALSNLPRVETVSIAGPGVREEHVLQIARQKRVREIVLDSTSLDPKRLQDRIPWVNLRVDRAWALKRTLQFALLGTETRIYTDDGVLVGPPSSEPPEVCDIVDVSTSHLPSGGTYWLQFFPGTTSLMIWDSEVRDEDLAPLTCLAGLRDLELARCSGISQAGLRHLQRIATLRELNLYESRVQDVDLIPIGSLVQLTRLDLDGTLITDRSVDTLAKLENLEYLDVRGTRLSKAAVESLKARLPDCTVRY